MREENISVAVMYPGGRIDRLTKPLFATDMNVSVEPNNPYEHDIVMLDNADKYIFKPIFKSRGKKSKVIYRIRGDMLRAYIEMNNTKLKYYIAKYMIGHVDAAISIEPILAEKFSRVTGVNPIGYAGLAKNLSDWPNVSHSTHNLRLISLTNCYYLDKVQPIIDYAPTVNEYLENNEGVWNIYGKGSHSSYLKDNLKSYENINFRGYTKNVKEVLKDSNCMLHLSRFDSMPNAILEGMACNLPIITNPYDVFTAYGFPLIIRNRSNINVMLEKLENPDFRKKYGQFGMENVRENHNPEVIGSQFAEFFKSIL